MAILKQIDVAPVFGKATETSAGLPDLVKRLYVLAPLTLSTWPSDVHEEICDLIDELLVTPDGEPAWINLGHLASVGWRSRIVWQTDQHGVPWWYGELFLWANYHVVFKYTGQLAEGV